MDYTALIAAYFLVLLLIGFLLRKVLSEKAFILADRQLTFPLLVATVAATFYGSSAVLGGASIANQTGLGVLWFIIPFYLGNLFLLRILPRIRRDESYTLPDFLGKYYGSKVALAASLLLAVLCLIPEAIIAGGRVLTLITPLSFESSMILIAAVIVTYTLLGGMRSVAITDLLKFSLLILSVLVLLPFLIIAIQSKGPETFLGSLPQGFTDPFSSMGLQDILVWCILLFFLPITSSPLYQRLFSSAPYVNAKKAILYCILLWLLIDTVVVFAGLLSVDYGQSDPDTAFIVVGQNLLPAELQALFFVGLIAAVMSAADSYLHAGASSLAHDVYKPLSGKGDGELVLASRIFVVLLGAVSLLLAFYFQQIIPALIFTLTVWTAGILIPTLAALFYLKLRPTAALAAIAFGSFSALACRFLPITDTDPLLVGLIASFTAAAVVNTFLRLRKR